MVSKDAKVKLTKLGIQGKLYFNCNLAPYSKFLWSTCKKLHDERLIDRFWVFNGPIFIAMEENESKAKKIEHLNDLENIFPGYDFSTKFSS